IHQAGFSNCVASLGTALTIRHARMLKKMVPEVIIAYDMDLAGQNAALRGLDMIAGIGCGVKILEMPEGKDPDDFIKKNGNAAFGSLIEKALPLVEYKAKLLRKKYNINERDGRLKFLNGIAKAISQVKNAIERETYIKRIAQDYSISKESIETEVMKHVDNGPSVSSEKITRLKSSLHVDTGAEMKNFMAVVAILCIRPELAGHAKYILNPEIIDDEEMKALLLNVLNRIENKGISDAAVVMGSLEDSQRELFTAAVTQVETSADMKKTLEEKASQYKGAVINRQINSMTAQYNQIKDKSSEKARKMEAELTELWSQLIHIKKK
ncbi:MAG: toprim domain-containing protein, partial [Clostridia bacterium]|nr:toprim domain-containing protein [Clostridia bacterium]